MTGKQMREIDPESIRGEIESLVRSFETELKTEELRHKVRALVPVFHQLRKLGKALLPATYTLGARERILQYFQQYPETVIEGDELMVVSGIQEYARRIRELRVEFGWAIATGVTIKEMQEEESGEEIPEYLKGMKPSQYILLESEPDRDGAFRWNIANTIRKQPGSVQDKILQFLRANVGKKVMGEELRYVAGDKTEWARRVRELRTESGWPVVTKSTGAPELPIGVYVLQADRQSFEHDRHIPDSVRRAVLRRDGYKCTECGWSHEEWNPSDPRHLELHHVEHHAKGGENTEENLRTVCTSCHDDIHRKEKN